LAWFFSLSEFFVHESAIVLFEVRDAIEDISPQVEIIPLEDDPAIFVEYQLGAPV
jgi:hypothetical protein